MRDITLFIISGKTFAIVAIFSCLVPVLTRNLTYNSLDANSLSTRFVLPTWKSTLDLFRYDTFHYHSYIQFTWNHWLFLKHDHRFPKHVCHLLQPILYSLDNIFTGGPFGMNSVFHSFLLYYTLVNKNWIISLKTPCTFNVTSIVLDLLFMYFS